MRKRKRVSFCLMRRKYHLLRKIWDKIRVLAESWGRVAKKANLCQHRDETIQRLRSRSSPTPLPGTRLRRWARILRTMCTNRRENG